MNSRPYLNSAVHGLSKPIIFYLKPKMEIFDIDIALARQADGMLDCCIQSMRIAIGRV